MLAIFALIMAPTIQAQQTGSINWDSLQAADFQVQNPNIWIFHRNFTTQFSNIGAIAFCFNTEMPPSLIAKFSMFQGNVSLVENVRIDIEPEDLTEHQWRAVFFDGNGISINNTTEVSLMLKIQKNYETEATAMEPTRSSPLYFMVGEYTATPSDIETVPELPPELSIVEDGHPHDESDETTTTNEANGNSMAGLAIPLIIAGILLILNMLWNLMPINFWGRDFDLMLGAMLICLGVWLI